MPNNVRDLKDLNERDLLLIVATRVEEDIPAIKQDIREIHKTLELKADKSQIEDIFKKLDTKTDCKDFDTLCSEINTNVKPRVSKLEEWRNYLAGGLAIIGFLVITSLSIVKEMVVNFFRKL